MLTGAAPLSCRLEVARGRFCPVPRGICLVCVFLKQPQCRGRGVTAKGVLGAGASGWPLGTQQCWGREKGMELGNRVESLEALERGRVPSALRTSCSWKGRSHPSSVPRGGALSRALDGCSLSLAHSSSGPWALRGGVRSAPPPGPLLCTASLCLPTRSRSGAALVLGPRPS